MSSFLLIKLKSEVWITKYYRNSWIDRPWSGHVTNVCALGCGGTCYSWWQEWLMGHGPDLYGQPSTLDLKTQNLERGAESALGVRKGYSQGALICFLCLPCSSETSAILMTEQTLSPGTHQIPILVTDSHNRACELPQTVLLDACFCDERHVCVHSSTTGIYNGDPTWVTEDTYGTGTDDGVGQSNVRLGPAGIGMIILGLLLLLCKYWKQSLYRHVGTAKFIGHFSLVSAAILGLTRACTCLIMITTKTRVSDLPKYWKHMQIIKYNVQAYKINPITETSWKYFKAERQEQVTQKTEVMEIFTQVDLSWAPKVEEFLRTVMHVSKSKRQSRTKKHPK